MKRGNGMKDRDERSRGIEIRITDAFVIIKPTEPFKLAKHEARRKRNWSDSSDNSFDKVDVSLWACKNKSRINSSYKRPVVSGVHGTKTMGSGRFK